MIRFTKSSKNVLKEYSLVFSADIWEQGRKLFIEHPEIKQVAVTDKNGKIICTAYQDSIANQELRMIKEIESYENALHFEEMYSDCDCVEINGCNELAYYTAKYIKNRDIPVVLKGQYWKYLDIESTSENANYKNVMTIYAEGTDDGSDTEKTVSVEFDCIYKLYMKNVKQDRIKKISNTVEKLITNLKEKPIYLLCGYNKINKVYDVYDYLLRFGIKVKGIIIDSINYSIECLKGIIGIDNIITFEKAVRYSEDIIVNCYSENGILGGGRLDEYVYNGFVRDKNYIFLKDYIDVPKLGLANTVKNKLLVLMGDKCLCSIMRKYFIREGISENDIAEFDEIQENVHKETLGIILVPMLYGTYIDFNSEINGWKKKLKEKNIMGWTDYFSDFRNLVYMDICEKKNTASCYTPRGIIFGNINAFSGNIFRRDCIDNHPEILQAGYSLLENTLFWYCIRLAEIPKQEIPNKFAELAKNEFQPYYECTISCENEFVSTIGKLLDKVEGQPSCYELFVIFYIVINKINGRDIDDITNYYLYWEPHCTPCPYSYAIWLNNSGIDGVIINGMRNIVANIGSNLRYVGIGKKENNVHNPAVWCLLPRNMKTIDIDGWKNIYQRFEDVKTAPQKTWGELCDKLNIKWSDTLLETTMWGKENLYTTKDSAVTGYDLKPVYNTYPEYMSPFDAFRIQMASMEFQCEFDYPYDSCLDFSRKELQDMFLMRYKVEDYLEFGSDEELRQYTEHRTENIKRIIVRELYNKSYYINIISEGDKSTAE